MDISSLNTKAASDEGRPMVLLHPETGEELTNDEGEPTVIYLLGADSQAVKDRQSSMHSKYRGKKEPPLAKLQREAVGLLALCTTKFENFKYQGEDLEYSYDAAMEIYSDRGFKWLYEQVDEFIHARSNYLGNSPKS